MHRPSKSGARCCTAAKLVIFPERVPTAHLLREVFEQHPVSTVFLTTSLFNWLIDEAPEVLSGVRQLMTVAGMRTPYGTSGGHRNFCRIFDLIHLYGPTETTTLATGYLDALHHSAQTVRVANWPSDRQHNRLCPGTDSGNQCRRECPANSG